MVGLSYACLNWLAKLHAMGLYSHGSVKRSDTELEWRLEEWASKIETNFEKHFRVFHDNPNETRKDLVRFEDHFIKKRNYSETLESAKIRMQTRLVFKQFCASKNRTPG